MSPDELRRRMAEGRAAFDRGDFFLAHELWEAVWLESAGDEKRWVQGLIQVAAGLHHLARSHPSAAARLLARALDKLDGAPAQLDLVDVDALRRRAADELGRLAPPEPAHRASRFEHEIREQPEAIARLLDEGRADAEAIARALRQAAPSFVLIAARGSSDNAARYAQYLLGAHHRLPVALAAPSLYTMYAAPPSLRGGVVLAISQSGRSPDIVAVVEDARRQGALAIVLTNEPEAPLARAASLCMTLRAGDEHAVAASKSYTAELVALAMISAALGDEPTRWRELATLPAAIAAAIERNGALDEAAARHRDTSRALVLARGFNHATAHEIALKLKETAAVVAEASSWADFLHGPVSLVDEGFPVLVVAPGGRVQDGALSLLDLLARRGARVIAVSDVPEVLGQAELALTLPPGVPEWLSPVVAVVPGQLWALALGAARGCDPDAPRGLTKVTQTR